MTAAPPRGSRVRPCARCGALNGADFDRCIRCGGPLSALAVGAERVSGGLGRFFDGQRLLATKVLLGLTTLVFAGQMADWLARGVMPVFMEGGVGVVIGAIRSGALPLSQESFVLEPWRALSAVFVHFSLLHFGLNMLALTNLARVAEPATGSARFVIAYVATGIIGFAASLGWSTWVSPLPFPIPTAGASGAIFGVMGLILGWLIRRRDPRWKQFAVQAVFYSLVFGLMIRANNAAHIGGLIAGVGFGLVYAGGRRRWAEPLVNVGAVLGLLISAAALALALRSPLWRGLDERVEGSRSSAAPQAVIDTGRPTV